MTPRQRLLCVLRGQIPDCVPVAPDFSNMIPARLTGKLMDGYFPLDFPGPKGDGPEWERFIVFRDEERIITQRSYVENGKRTWEPHVDVFYVADPPTGGVPSNSSACRQSRSGGSRRTYGRY